MSDEARNTNGSKLLGKRKFLAFLLIVALAEINVALGWINGDNWEGVMLACAGFYAAGNVLAKRWSNGNNWRDT